MSVYVINKRKEPLMPTTNSKARTLLKNKKAKIFKYNPFTIQLTEATGESKQEITLGVDAGSKMIGLSATTKKIELYSSEVELRNDIVKLLASRSATRRTRRGRLRYREARFLNRVKSKHKGWIAPSIKHKIYVHLRAISEVHNILPIANIIVETASFDIQKILNPNIQGKEYQEGTQMEFWNVRQYVLSRDHHKCTNCKGKSKDSILQVHHIESRQTGGNAPNNLATLCKTCHHDYHKGKIKLKLKRGEKFTDATFMGIMRWRLYDALKELYANVSMTYGYITKNTRIENSLPKSHRVDARCISGNPIVKPSDYYYHQKKVRCHNRQIHKANILKGGKKKNNQASYLVKGFRLFDKVRYQTDEYFIFGRRNSGYFDIRTLDGTKVKNGSVSYKLLTLSSTRQSMLCERRKAIPPLT